MQTNRQRSFEIIVRIAGCSASRRQKEKREEPFHFFFAAQGLLKNCPESVNPGRDIIEIKLASIAGAPFLRVPRE